MMMVTMMQMDGGSDDGGEDDVDDDCDYDDDASDDENGDGDGKHDCGDIEDNRCDFTLRFGNCGIQLWYVPNDIHC